MCLFAIPIASLVKYQFMTFSHFLIRWFISLPLSFKYSLCILDMNSWSDMWLVFYYFSQIIAFPLFPLTGFFMKQKIFSPVRILDTFDSFKIILLPRFYTGTQSEEHRVHTHN